MSATRKTKKHTPASRSSYKTAVGKKPANVLQRLFGVVTLKPEIYREIAHDNHATTQAGVIVAIVAVVVGVISAMAAANLTLSGMGSAVPVRKPLGVAIVIVIQELLIWLCASWFIAGVVRGYYRGNTDTSEMLRVFGYTRIFQILSVLGVFSGALAAVLSLAGLGLSIAGSIIGIREAAGFTTGKAAAAGIFAIVLAAVLISFIAAFVLNPIVTFLLPT